MKIRNIMFTGFMAAILASTAGAATVPVASKGYVDAKVGVNTSSISSLTEKVTANETAIAGEKSAREAADSALDTRVTASETAITNLQNDKADKGTKLSDYGITDAYTKGETDTAIAEAVKGTMEGDVSAALGDYLKKTEAETLYETIAAAQATNTAQDTKITANTNALTTLNGNATVEGSVAKSIADAINELDLANTYDAKGSAEAALEAAKTYADENDADTIYDDSQVKVDIAKNASAIASGDAATLQSAKDYADGLADNYDAKGSASQALADAKKYTDDEIDALETSLSGTSTNLTELTTRVTTAEGEIDTLQGTVGNAESGLVKGVADNAGAITALETTVGDESAGLVKDVADIKSELTDKITMPDVCDKTTCVLTVNSATKDLEWMPLTEPVEDFLSE